MSLGRPLPSQALLNQFLPQTSISDIIWNPLYDSANYGTAGQTVIQFFTVGLGSGTSTSPSATAGSAKTLADTNVPQGGQLTLGNAFLATGQELLFFPGGNPNEGYTTGTAVANFLNDVYAFGKDGVLTMTAGSNRTYIQDGPLGVFPPSTNIATAPALAVAAATTNATTTYAWSDYASWIGEAYTIEPLFLQANLQFNETLVWGQPTALPSAKTARVFSRLRGYLIRLAQ